MNDFTGKQKTDAEYFPQADLSKPWTAPSKDPRGGVIGTEMLPTYARVKGHELFWSGVPFRRVPEEYLPNKSQHVYIQNNSLDYSKDRNGTVEMLSTQWTGVETVRDRMEAMKRLMSQRVDDKLMRALALNAIRPLGVVPIDPPPMKMHRLAAMLDFVVDGKAVALLKIDDSQTIALTRLMALVSNVDTDTIRYWWTFAQAEPERRNNRIEAAKCVKDCLITDRKWLRKDRETAYETLLSIVTTLLAVQPEAVIFEHRMIDE